MFQTVDACIPFELVSPETVRVSSENHGSKGLCNVERGETVRVSSENHGSKGLCNVERGFVCYFQLPGFGPIQRVQDMTPHKAHCSFFVWWPLFLFFGWSHDAGPCRPAVRVVFTVFTMRWVLQFLRPEELFQLEARWGTTVFKLLFTWPFLDQSFKVSLRNVWVFWL